MGDIDTHATRGRHLMWFRRDLRVHDNPALTAAAAADEMLAIFVLDPAIVTSSRVAPARLVYLRHALADLSAQMTERGGRLVVLQGDPADLVSTLVADLEVEALHVTADHSPFAAARDAAIAEVLRSTPCTFVLHEGVAIQPPGAVLTGSGTPYKVFTPFSRRWADLPRRPLLAPPTSLPDPVPGAPEGLAISDVEILTTAQNPPQRDDDGGETAARQRLERWLQGPVDAYDTARNTLADDGTSRLSADLHFGCLSPLEVFEQLDDGDDGQRAFGRQIVWRDFYLQVLAEWPGSATAAFREEYRSLEWVRDDAGLEAWKDGRTGYPLVDAGMRQLQQTGWMHNRARMVVASFLCKDLLIDWREGEGHFMSLLVDGDVANNVGGWQWAAGTGTDAQPFVRIFNPVTQSERFDPEGRYIRRWVPELRELPAPAIHAPWTAAEADLATAGVRLGEDYPSPMVDHAEARRRALDWFDRRR